MPVEWHRHGIRLIGSTLFFDAVRKTELSFVSHAHRDHIARHACVVATKETLALVNHRLGPIDRPLPAPYFRPFELGPLNLELLPAGHVLGSAQLRVITADGTRVVFTGDLNTERSLTAEPCAVAECDTLVIESTFGHPRFKFPPRARVLDDIERWIRARQAEGRRPVLFAYALGKAQEIVGELSTRGFRVVAHPDVFAVSQLYESFGVAQGARKFEGEMAVEEVGVFPPFAKSYSHRHLENCATAVLTGWAMDAAAVQRYRTDAAFPLSDHADAEALVRYAKATGAQRVVTHHGFADELAAELNRAGIQAQPVDKRVQLSLAL